MKAYFASLAVFGLLLILIAVNAFCVARIATDLFEKIEALPAAKADGGEEVLAALMAEWEKKRPIFCISTSYETVQGVTDSLLDMQHAQQTGDAAEYEVARSRAKNLMRRIRQSEQLHWGNIL